MSATTRSTHVSVRGECRRRWAITDRGLTFATNGDRGVLVTFAAAVRGLDPLGLLRHPELTVTVADTKRLTAVLSERLGLQRP
jgi:hypothetical protein